MLKSQDLLKGSQVSVAVVYTLCLFFSVVVAFILGAWVTQLELCAQMNRLEVHVESQRKEAEFWHNEADALAQRIANIRSALDSDPEGDE